MTKQEQYLIKIYQDFVKNYKSMDVMALAHDMSLIDLERMLESGRELQTKYSKEK